MPAGAIWLPAESPDALPDPGEVGGKAYNLARLVRAGAPVPPFFVVGARAFARVLGDVPVPEDDAAAEAAQARALAVEVPPGLRQALGAALAALGGGPVAVRSSAVGEDGGRSSFAGQFETVLGVPAHDEAAAWRAVRRVWASAFHPRALAYRRERGEGGGAMAVVVQRMVEPAAAGVAFSADPVTGDRATAVVSAVYGLGEGLVSGALDADTYRVRFGGGGPAVVEAALARKEQAYRTDPAGGVRVEPVPGWLAGAPALSDGEVRRIAEAARALAADFGAEQDVEWALAPGPGGRRVLYLLQAR
ncbi:MAG TPA: PEP/pyruvate-binding domain-containing protein, partial [Longimicrobiaceae bacterium]|nr:PEP/pyruvate-binding domain-containing protein [Longimicrobiaceae bacterium]